MRGEGSGLLIRLRIDCAYDGTNFHGWARQPHLRTVQGELEADISRILHLAADDAPAALVVAGRTDAGVHARGQVCHCDVDEQVLARAVGHLPLSPVEAFEHRLRFIVPVDIAIHRVSVAPSGFDARFSALQRTYVYRIADRFFEANPLIRMAALRCDHQLDVGALNACAALIPGLRDFGSFAIPNPGGTTIREVKAARWQRISRAGSLEDGLLTFTITADAFARSMVRSLVGAQVEVGRGRRSVEWFADKLAHPQRDGATGPIDPHGLTLERVEYPADSDLARRAAAIRAKRTLPEG